jgi:integrase
MVTQVDSLAMETKHEPQQRKRFVMARKKSYQRGSVKKHNGQWTLRYRELDHASGKWINKREILGDFKSEKEARRLVADAIMVGVNERNSHAKSCKAHSEITFREFIAGRWRAYTVSAKHQPSTLDSHNSLIKRHLLPFFGEMKLHEVMPTDIGDFLQKECKIVSGNTMQNLYGLLHIMFDIAQQYDLIEQSPVRPKLHKPEFEKVKKPAFSVAQVQILLEQLSNEQERLFASLLAVTGMRMGEALALRWVDFNWTERKLSINHTLYRQKLKKPKTESSEDSLRLGSIITTLLQSHRETSRFHSEDDFIFCRTDGRPLNPSALRNHLYQAMDALKIQRVKGKFGHHILRHSAGSALWKKTRDLKVVQSTLRHADVGTTSGIYIHLDEEVLAEGPEILDREILANCTLFAPKESRLVS